MTRSREFVLAVVALSVIGVGTVSVEGLPTCERYVKTFVEKRVKNPVSRTTALRWAEWGKQHPDFKPKPRPRTKLVKQEVTRKVDFACNVEAPNPDLLTGMPEGPLPEISLDQLPVIPISFEPPLPPSPTDVAMNGAPPLIFVPPYTTGLTPPVATPVPEPSQLVMLLSGFGLLLAFAKTWRANRGPAGELA